MRILLPIICLVLLSSCDYYIINSYENQVGYISNNNTLGDKDFKVCLEEHLFPFYYGRKPASFTFGKDSIRRYFDEQYSNQGVINESGYITIRFIINCKGEAGRYEILQIGKDYKKKIFNQALVDHLFTLTRNLKDWNPIELRDTKFDSFIHMTFKIENGELLEILP